MTHIRYLEDDTALASVTQRALEKRGFKVTHAANLDQLRQHAAKKDYDRVLLDLKIGNDTSLPLIKEIYQIKAAPIVVLTGYGTIRTAVQAVKLGAINFLSKPCPIDEVLAAFEDEEETADVELEDADKPSLKAMEWEVIQQALDDNEGNISAAARQLKMHRRTLQRKLKKKHIVI